jgi:hypothetical protein
MNTSHKLKSFLCVVFLYEKFLTKPQQCHCHFPVYKEGTLKYTAKFSLPFS